MLISNISFSQTLTKGQKPSILFAKYCLKFENYFDGLIEFKALLKENPDNDYYRWGVGYCHLHLNKDKAASIPYFIKVLSVENANPEYYYDLGEAYLVTNQLEKAKENFELYIQKFHNDKHAIPANRMLQMIENAKVLMQNPIKVNCTNLGPDINTEYPEFNPLINSNEKLLVYSMQNPYNNGKYRHEDGYYAADVYYSNFKFGKWKNNRKFSSMINSKNIEIGQSMTSNAAKLIVYNEDIEKRNKHFFVYSKRGRYYGYPQEIMINGFDMTMAKQLCYSSDNKYIVFSAPNKDGIRNDLDLYYSRLSPDGFWMAPELLDSNINTEYDDSYPYFSPDNQHFYFASKGHNSMGGYDIFECEFELDSFLFSIPKNLGYPVNTTMDDEQISFNRSGRYAYKACLRDDGLGDLDIYRIVFEDKNPLLTIVHGFVFDQDSTKLTEVVNAINLHIDTLNFPVNHEYKRIFLEENDSIRAVRYLHKNTIPHEKLDVNISVVDTKTKQNVGKFIVKEKSAGFAIILPPGEYDLIFSRKDFEDKFYANFIIEDFDLRNRDVEMHVLLKMK